jgi:integrase
VSTATKATVAFTGPLAAILTGLVAEKQGAGYRYDGTARNLLQLDRFCVSVGHDDTSLPREMVLRWTAKRSNETETNRQHRICLIRIVGEYMRRCGYPAYVYPRHADSRTPPRYTPYIFSRAELARFFNCVDACEPDRASPQRHRVFPVLFRLLYGCGLRVSEALALRVADIDLPVGTVHIRDAKFGKERLVPLHPSLVGRFRVYLSTSADLADPDRSVFASPLGDAYVPSTIYACFRQFLWAAGISHGGRGRGPRLHDLRHTFAVHCLQRWVTEGTDLAVALPYLSAYLGHTGLKGTQDYLRLTAELYPQIVTAVERQFGPMLPGGGLQG